MNDHDILMAAILATPEDDAPRLAYADWLDENGQEERAAFIRVQVNRHAFRLQFGMKYIRRGSTWWTWGCVHKENVPRKAKYRRVARRISLEAAVIISNHPREFRRLVVGVSRGFVDEIRCTFADYIRYAPAIARCHPITRWSLTDAKFLQMPGYKKGSVYFNAPVSAELHQSPFFNAFVDELQAAYPSYFPSEQVGRAFIDNLLVRMAREWSQKLIDTPR